MQWYIRSLVIPYLSPEAFVIPMFLVNKPKLIPQGAFEAWLWRRWHSPI
jgi:hypothetical protein